MLIGTTYGKEYQESLSLKEVFNIYHKDVTAIELEAQLESMKTNVDEKEDITLAGITDEIKKLPKSSKVYFSEVISPIKILLVLPGTNAVSERSVSTLHRVKNWHSKVNDTGNT